MKNGRVFPDVALMHENFVIAREGSGPSAVLRSIVLGPEPVMSLHPSILNSGCGSIFARMAAMICLDMMFADDADSQILTSPSLNDNISSAERSLQLSHVFHRTKSLATDGTSPMLHKQIASNKCRLIDDQPSIPCGTNEVFQSIAQVALSTGALGARA